MGLAEEASARVQAQFGFSVSGRRILDVGPGQFLVQSRYFARTNEVVGIDTEIIAQDLTVRSFFEMIRFNGLQRAVKTLARKALGVDSAYEKAFRELLGERCLPKIRLDRGDVCRMPFPDGSFDMIYSRAVLHHIPKPELALSEMARVLKDCGVIYLDLHLYSSVNGSLDSRVLFESSLDLSWAHLRGIQDVVEGASVNRLRLSEWRGLFAEKWPGSIVETVQLEDEALHRQAEILLSKGEISGYSQEELVTTTLIAIWQKPGVFASVDMRSHKGQEGHG